MTSRLKRNRHTLLNPPMFGSEKNHSFSTLQINTSPLTKRDLSSSLGYAGRSHIDRHNDPFSLTILTCLSYLNSNTNPGYFYMGETHECSKLKPFSLEIFRGTGPHGGTQAIPPGEPDELEKRINLILYPRREFVNRTVDEILFGAKLFETPSIRKRGYPCFKYIKNQTYLRQGAINKQAIPIAVIHSLIDSPCNC